MRIAAERFAVEPQSITHVVHRRRAVNQTELLAEARAQHLLEVRTRGHDFADHVRVGMQQRFALGSDDRGVHHEYPTAARGLQHVVQVNVGLQVLDQGATDCDRIVGVDGRAAEVGQVVFRSVGQLMRQLFAVSLALSMRSRRICEI